MRASMGGWHPTDELRLHNQNVPGPRGDVGWSRTEDIESVTFTDPLQYDGGVKYRDYEPGDWRDQEHVQPFQTTEFDGPALDNATEAVRDAEIPYRVERQIGNAKQLGMGLSREGFEDSYSEPIFADVETYSPRVHHTQRDGSSMRRRLRQVYRGGG